ncbi:endo-1,4-beta-xylanase xylA, putative (macronuclear) [Tetrahymena thermophila SB210]|uniref:Endo-1,4-beta-xylanase xylA, putative n=1 Tax=Tetrahymena thermophila (strain SB210) TaxID=312017 RepID=I7MD53_TETTS|nr:endo-1,4-beta-xylanase xylA, putative [Tetrahymena thermophila SB210]EAR85517.1 endo-1,4-beta-xylanase xylA, putative [Tetrahymena thermophila SB210]|eukprot:XP_001033180.1 endo-1,4-beta-xylanase xylA, putative [Tetrahymena thermophila SB210]
MEHLDINPYTPGQVCMEINSKNSEKSIMKNLFSYFNKKQQKMNNGFNKILNSQSQSNKNQRLTIYTPMIEGLVNSKRDAISSVDSASRKNFIQQNRNFIVKKTRPQTTNPNQRQSIAKSMNQQQKDQIYTFQELDKQEVLLQERNNYQNVQSLQTSKQDGLKVRQNNPTHSKNEAESIDRQNQKQGLKQQRSLIKKSVVNSVFGQTLNNSFESIQSRKNSFNRKVKCTLNSQNQQTQEALETQAGTTIQACNADQIKNTDCQTINSNCDKYQLTQIMNQTISQQQNEYYNSQQINNEQLKTEESDQQYKYSKIQSNKDQSDFQHHNSHFCSKSTNYQHTISSQNNDFIVSQKNAEDATIDTLINAHIKKSQDYSQINSFNNQGVEKISNILTKKQNQESNLDLSIDQQLIDESYRNLLNERPPVNKKNKTSKIKVRSSSCLAEEGKLQKQSQSSNSKHNNSCNQFSLQSNQIYQNEKRQQEQSTQGSLNQQIQNNEQYHQNNIESQSYQKVNQNTYNSNNSLNKNPYLLSDQYQQSVEQQQSKGLLSIKTQFLTQESFDKRENKEYYQVTIEEDIQNFTTIEEKEQDQKKEELNYKEKIPSIQRNQNNLNYNQQQNLSVIEANQSLHKTPQKDIDINVNSLQNSMNQILMKSNHITFNVMSNTKDQFNNNQSNNAFNYNSQISDNKFMTSSFDAQNQIQFDPKANDEIKAQEQFNQMKEYIQCQIDSNKQVINQYYKNNFSSKKNLQVENQGLNTSSQKQLINQNKPIATTEFGESKLISQQIQSRPVSSKRPLVSQRKVSIEKKFNFYDELDKKLEEKKKNIMKIALETQIQNDTTIQKHENLNKGNALKGFNSGRNNSLQINQQQQAQKIPLSQRRKSTQETSRFNTNNLVLNESKINNYNISELKGIPSKINNQIFILKDNIDNGKIQEQQSQKIQKQAPPSNDNCLNPIQSQIYYQQFLLSNKQKENIHPQKQSDTSQLLILQGEPHLNQSSQTVNSKQSRPPSNYQNQQKQYQQQDQIQTLNQENYNISQQQPEQLQNKSILSNNQTQDFGYFIPTNQKISRKYRSNTVDNTFENNQRKQINYIQAHSSEKQSIQNTGRNSIAASKVKLSREEQLQVIKEVQIQSQNKLKLHQYLQQNKQIHMQMKHFSETINKNNISLNQSIQNQLGSSINNFSSNCLNNLCATQQTMSMEVNNQFQSSLKKSINELTNLQTTQEFLQSMKLANNTQNSFREDLNSSQLNNNAFQKYGQSSTRKQNPLLYSDQSNLHKNYVVPFTEVNIEMQQNQQFGTQVSQNMLFKTKEFNNSFNLQSQAAPLKSSVEINQNNVQFYENLNQNTISQEIDLDQKVYANHQYQYALKRQQRRDDHQILQRLDQNNQELYAQNINQWTQSKQIINKNQQNTLELQKNFQQQAQNIRNKNIFEGKNQNAQQSLVSQNQGSKFKQTKQINISHLEKENIYLNQNQPNLHRNQQYNDDYIQSNRGRQANSKTSQRYYIQLNEDFEEKTLEYSGSKAGVENQF